MVEPDVVLVLVLGIRIGIECIAVENRIESTSGGQYALKESNNLRLNVAGIRSYRNLVVQIRCTGESRTCGNRRVGVIQLVDYVIVLVTIITDSSREAGIAYGTEITAIHGRGGNQDWGRDGLGVPESLVRKVEECVLLQTGERNWTTESSAELMLVIVNNFGKLIL